MSWHMLGAKPLSEPAMRTIVQTFLPDSRTLCSLSLPRVLLSYPTAGVISHDIDNKGLVCHNSTSPAIWMPHIDKSHPQASTPHCRSLCPCANQKILIPSAIFWRLQSAGRNVCQNYGSFRVTCRRGLWNRMAMSDDLSWPAWKLGSGFDNSYIETQTVRANGIQMEVLYQNWLTISITWQSIEILVIGCNT